MPLERTRASSTSWRIAATRANSPRTPCPRSTRRSSSGVRFLELDVQLSRDGVPVVIHDHLLARTTGLPGSVFDTDARRARAPSKPAEPRALRRSLPRHPHSRCCATCSALLDGRARSHAVRRDQAREPARIRPRSGGLAGARGAQALAHAVRGDLLRPGGGAPRAPARRRCRSAGCCEDYDAHTPPQVRGAAARVPVLRPREAAAAAGACGAGRGAGSSTKSTRCALALALAARGADYIETMAVREMCAMRARAERRAVSARITTSSSSAPASTAPACAQAAAAAGHSRAAARADRHRRRLLEPLEQADPRRPALPRIGPVPAGAREPARARAAAAAGARAGAAAASSTFRSTRTRRRRPWQLRIGLSLYALLAGLDAAARASARVPRRDWEQLDGLDTRGLQTGVLVPRCADRRRAADRARWCARRRRSAPSWRCPARFVGAALATDGVRGALHGSGSASGMPRARARSTPPVPGPTRCARAITPAIAVPALELRAGHAPACSTGRRARASTTSRARATVARSSSCRGTGSCWSAPPRCASAAIRPRSRRAAPRSTTCSACSRIISRAIAALGSAEHRGQLRRPARAAGAAAATPSTARARRCWSPTARGGRACCRSTAASSPPGARSPRGAASASPPRSRNGARCARTDQLALQAAVSRGVLALDQGSHASRACIFDARGATARRRRWSGRDRARSPHAGRARRRSELLESCAPRRRRRCGSRAAHGPRSQIDRRRPRRRSARRSCAARSADRQRARRPRSPGRIGATPPGSRASRRAPRIRELTGLPMSPHYGASKLRWCLDHLAAGGARRGAGELLRRRSRVTLPGGCARAGCAAPRVDAANASRTLLFDPEQLDWSEELLRIFAIERAWLPLCTPTRTRFGVLQLGEAGSVASRPIVLRAVTGDQSAIPFAFGAPDTACIYINLGTGALPAATAERSSHRCRAAAGQRAARGPR